MRPGTRLGPYEIVSQIGAGGMGEVYRARDARLRRDVAVKVLPAAFSEDAERLLRFEQEARATAALNHPNILAIFDVGTHESQPYLVEELLSGRSLRECLKSGPLPVSKAIELAVQITSGLAAAHGKGIVHRDLKPENLFVTSDGAVKILDFGLAKLARPDVAGEATATATATPSTGSGTVLGTVGYMAPEQIRGQPCDHRADIFAFGCVLYEMVSGQRAFSGETPADTLAAILSQDPAPLSGTGREVPPLLAGIVSRCLQKSPEERFQSARDLAFQLDMMARLSGVASGPTALTDAPRPRGVRRAILAGAGLAAVVLVLGAGALLDRQLGRRSQGFPDVRFTPLTFRRGVVTGTAHFTADGQTVVYSARWDGAPSQLFSTRLGGPESAALGYDNANLCDVSPTGELALFRWARSWALATAPFSGGTPRDIDEQIIGASYSPDGRSMAVIRTTDKGDQLEFPVGTVRAKGHLRFPRLSPDGKRLAFVSYAKRDPTERSGVVDPKLCVMEASGREAMVIAAANDLQDDWNGLAWSPDGSELWLAEQTGSRTVLLGVTPSGRRRAVYIWPGNITLQDVARNGRVLMTIRRVEMRVLFNGEGDTPERDLTWLDYSMPGNLSVDGRTLVFFESQAGVGNVPTVFLRDTSGAPPVKLGPGVFPRLSPDGSHVAAILRDKNEVVVYPVGPGAVRSFAVPGVEVSGAVPLAGGTAVCLTGNEPSRGARLWVMEVGGAKPRAFSPEGVVGYRNLTPDGRNAVGKFKDALWLFPLSGGEPTALNGVHGDEWIAALSADARFAYVYEPLGWPIRVSRVDLRSGERVHFRDFGGADRAGMGSWRSSVSMTPDGRSAVYGYTRETSTLYLVEGLR